MAVCGAVGAMVVVVDQPGRDPVAALLLGVVGGGVEDLAGEGLLVSLYLAVVLGCVGLDPLMPGRERFDRSGETVAR